MRFQYVYNDIFPKVKISKKTLLTTEIILRDIMISGWYFQQSNTLKNY